MRALENYSSNSTIEIIKVSQLLPNPFRNLDVYPLNPAKVERLKASIQETFFWDNLIARPSPTRPGFYELAYGAHRLEALKELGVSKVSRIPVMNLSDEIMIKIMADENLEEWAPHPSVTNETMRPVLDLYKQSLTKSWSNLSSNLRAGFRSQDDYKRQSALWTSKSKIVTAKFVEFASKFLGKGWSRWLVKESATNVLNEHRFDMDALNKFPTLKQATTFRDTARHLKIPFDRQSGIADTLVKEGRGIRDIRSRTSEILGVSRGPKVSIAGRKIEEYAYELVRKVQTAYRNIDPFIEVAHHLKERDREDLIEELSHLRSSTHRLLLELKR
jgi:hypothetical protein